MLYYVPNVAFNVATLLANSGFKALQDARNLRQALLLDRILSLLASRPILIPAAGVVLAAMTGLGIFAHRDRQRERAFLAREEELDRERLFEKLLQRPPKAPTPEPETQGAPTVELPRAEHFVGRVEELDRLLTFLRHGGAVSIIAVKGIGGIGKTALAAEAIASLRAAAWFPDGIAIVIADGKSNATDVLREVLSRFDPRNRQPDATTPDGLRQAAHRLLDGKQVLIVIDNVEPGLNIKQVVDPLVGAGATVLLTSRQDLPADLDAESLRLDVLSEADAIELFAQDYGAGSARDLTATQRADIATIVNSLGRLTLAVRLAARYAADLARQGLPNSLRELATELASNPTEAAVELPPSPGVGTIDIILTKSERALLPEGRVLFASFGAFGTAEFGVEAAMAVAEGLGFAEPAELIALLVRRALVDTYPLSGLPENADRQRLRLHPILHAFAKQRANGLDQHKIETTRRLIAHHYAQYVTAVGRDALGADEVNVREALEWAIAQHRDEIVASLCAGMQAFWRDYGRSDARERYLPLGLASARRFERRYRTREARRIHALLKLGNAQRLRLKGNLPVAERMSRGILETFRESGDHGAEGSTLVLRANLARDRGHARDLDEAEQDLHEALRAFGEAGDQANQALAHAFLGQVAQRRGDWATAEEQLAESERVYAGIHNSWGVGLALALKGRIPLQEERYQDAAPIYQRALAIHRELHARRSEGVDLSSLGQIAYGQGSFEEAEYYYGQALAIRQETSDRRGEAVDKTLQGQLYRTLSRFDEARACLEAARKIWDAYADTRGRGWVVSELGQLALAEGQYERALLLLRESLALRREAEDLPGEGIDLRALAEVAIRRGKPREVDSGGVVTILRVVPIHWRGRLRGAEALLSRALDIAHSIRNRAEEARVIRLSALLAEHQRRFADAERWYRHSLSVARETGLPLEIARACYTTGRLLATERHAKAESCQLLAEAARTYQRLSLPEAADVRKTASQLGCDIQVQSAEHEVA